MTQEADRREPPSSPSLRLTITTPNVLLVDEEGVLSVRAEDETGGFGILPGHAEFLTVLPACVVRWRNASGLEAYCALRGGVLTASRGQRVSIACRQGVLGQDLQKLEDDARRARAVRLDEAARARVRADPPARAHGAAAHPLPASFGSRARGGAVQRGERGVVRWRRPDWSCRLSTIWRPDERASSRIPGSWGASRAGARGAWGQDAVPDPRATRRRNVSPE